MIAIRLRTKPCVFTAKPSSKHRQGITNEANIPMKKFKVLKIESADEVLEEVLAAEFNRSLPQSARTEIVSSKVTLCKEVGAVQSLQAVGIVSQG